MTQQTTLTNEDNLPRGILRLYGAGGAGTNIVGRWHAMDGQNVSGTAKCVVAYADTSRANLPSDIQESHVFLLADKDGSGGVRKENHTDISRNVAGLLQKHPPGDLNVVCFSAAGGSGSVFGPLIVKALIEASKPVVVVVIGAEESTIRRDNTMNTLKSLDNIARKSGVPIVVCYDHNAPDAKRSDVDKRCGFVLASLAVLGSRQNRELDTADLAHWLNYPKVTSVDAQLSLLHVYRDPKDVDLASNPVSIASLQEDPDQKTYSIVPEYSTRGYPREKIGNGFTQLHFVITTDGVRTIEKMLSERLTAARTLAGARVQHDSIVKPTDQVCDDGMIM
jgi:hypothetical protein